MSRSRGERKKRSTSKHEGGVFGASKGRLNGVI